jgi:hypothetical protein
MCAINVGNQTALGNVSPARSRSDGAFRKSWSRAGPATTNKNIRDKKLTTLKSPKENYPALALAKLLTKVTRAAVGDCDGVVLPFSSSSC